eukprot:gene23266-31592_t
MGIRCNAKDTIPSGCMCGRDQGEPKTKDGCVAMLPLGRWLQNLCLCRRCASPSWAVDFDILRRAAVASATGDIKLISKRKSKGFSKFKTDQEEARWSQTLSEADFNTILLRVTEDIVYRSEVIDRDIASEYTRHEFISPILVGALKNSNNSGKLSLICEKIVGMLLS